MIHKASARRLRPVLILTKKEPYCRPRASGQVGPDRLQNPIRRLTNLERSYRPRRLQSAAGQVQAVTCSPEQPFERPLHSDTGPVAYARTSAGAGAATGAT